MVPQAAVPAAHAESSGGAARVARVDEPGDARTVEADRRVVPAPREPRRLDSRDLLGGQTVVLIDHGGETYRLQATRLGKLILTK